MPLFATPLHNAHWDSSRGEASGVRIALGVDLPTVAPASCPVGVLLDRALPDLTPPPEGLGFLMLARQSGHRPEGRAGGRSCSVMEDEEHHPGRDQCYQDGYQADHSLRGGCDPDFPQDGCLGEIQRGEQIGGIETWVLCPSLPYEGGELPGEGLCPLGKCDLGTTHGSIDHIIRQSVAVKISGPGQRG